MITAPYNFVPLNKEVFYPSWSKQVSHDIPFEDGESGEIDITITAKSPIFIRDHENEELFCQHNGQYYIPSSSIKGMVRNVLEIVSFGEINIDKKLLSKQSSIRDMSNPQEMVGVATGCGFLKQNANDDWFIEDYGKPRTIEYDNTRTKILRLGNQTYTLSTGNNNENMSSKDKYNLIGTNYPIIKIEKSSHDSNINGKTITRPIAISSQTGENAYLVLTGEITNKKHEFVFALSDKKETPITKIEDAIERFQSVYFHSDSVDGNFWKNNYNPEIGIPIFYRKKDDIYDIGLTQLFKLAYPNTIKNSVKQTVNTSKLDLAKTIFGAINKETDSLKGRVYFSHFKTEAHPQIFKENLTITLGGPKPSFYPTYISQNCQNDGKVQNNNYHSLMQDSAMIAGWKRYPIHHNKPNVKSVPQSDTTTTFNPLGIYTQDNIFQEFSFSGKLRYHNLKPQELGAILCALTFHDNEENFYHNIGLAKAHGFGKIKIHIDTNNHQEALKSFEGMMTLWTKEKLQKEWVATEQIKELFSMHYKNTDIDTKLKYLVLDPDNRINQFVDAKNAKGCLPKFSVLSNFTDVPNSLLNEEYFKQLEQKALKDAEVQKEENAFDLAFKSENLQLIENFIKKYPDNKKMEQLQAKILKLEDTQKNNQFSKVNEEAQKSYDGAIAQKDKNKRKQFLQSWIKKWEAEKNNKGSNYILELITKAKLELK